MSISSWIVATATSPSPRSPQGIPGEPLEHEETGQRHFVAHCLLAMEAQCDGAAYSKLRHSVTRILLLWYVLCGVPARARALIKSETREQLSLCATARARACRLSGITCRGPNPIGYLRLRTST